MTVFVFSLVAYLLFALETPLLGELGLTLFAPDLSVALLLAAAPRTRASEHLLFAFVVGLIADAFTPLAPLGLNMERAVVLAYVMRTLLSHFPVRTMAGRVLVGMVLTLVSDFLLFVLLALFDRSFSEHGLIFRRMIPHALVTAPAIPLVEWIIDGSWRRIIGRRDGIFF